MKNFLFSLGIIISFLLHGNLSEIQPDINMQRMMSQIQNLTEWCELTGMDLDECETLINDADATEATDEDGEKVLVSGVEEKEIKMAKFDACNIRERTVYMPVHPNNYIVWPPCTRVKRCGGCTTSSVLACNPTAVTEKFLKVFDVTLPYPGAQRFDPVGVRVVKVLEHLACEAQCRITEDDCYWYQTYDSYQCSCPCSDETLVLKELCTADTHMWDDELCECVCRNFYTHECKEPAYFNEETCKCTLKTLVAGEIDMDKLLDDLKKGLIVLPNTEYNATETEGPTTDENADPDGDESETNGKEGSKPAEGKAKIDTATEHGNETKEGLETGKSTLPTMPTFPTRSSTTPATSTPTITTTTTQAESTTTENPCPDTKCFGSWKPILVDGECKCAPPKRA